MTKATKKPKRAPKVSVRPGECVVENVTDAVIFVGDPALNGPNPLDNYAYVVDPGVRTIVPRRVFQYRRDGYGFVKSGSLRVVDATEGKLAATVNVSDSHARAVARDGEWKPDRGQVLNGFKSKYLEHSLGEAIFLLVEAGWDEEVAAEILVREYDDSFIRANGDATRKSWVTLGQKLLEQSRERQELESVTGQPAQGGGDTT
jgi:hypothetical protein